MNGTDDDKIWEHYTKGVKRCGVAGKNLDAGGRSSTQKPAAHKSDVVEDAQRAAEGPAPPLPIPSREKFESPVQAALDRRVERNMREGNVIIEARLDLHGVSEQDAYDRLLSFVETQTRRGKRLLLVITGKGREGESVLRANFPRWCAEPGFALPILALRPAAPQHGGDGAWYVMLRKTRHE